jgi:hypothetical protein
MEIGCGISSLPQMIHPDDIDYYVGFDSNSKELDGNFEGASDKFSFVVADTVSFQDDREFDALIALGIDLPLDAIDGCVDLVQVKSPRVVIAETAKAYAPGMTAKADFESKISQLGYQKEVDMDITLNSVGHLLKGHGDWNSRNMSVFFLTNQ